MISKMILQTEGGLANRMRAIDSAIAICRKYSCPLEVVWSAYSHGINARFGDVFEPILLPNVSVREATTLDRWFFEGSRRKKHYWARVLRYFVFPGKTWYWPDVVRLVEQGRLDTLFHGPGDMCYLASGGQIVPTEDHFSMFRPLPHDAITQRTQSFQGRRCFGVHVRRGDHVQATHGSPLELFIFQMRKEFDGGAECCYLATDSEDVKKELRALFGTRVITSDKVADRTTVAGIQEAVVELYTLSSTRKIFGSCGSTFAETAAWIGRKGYAELALETHVTKGQLAP